MMKTLDKNSAAIILATAAVLFSALGLTIFVANGNSFDLEITSKKILRVEGFHLWQHTWIDVKPGDQLLIRCLSWNPMYPPEGQFKTPVNSKFFVLESVPLGALVGRISNTKFLISQGTKYSAGEQDSGELRICPNLAYKSAPGVEATFKSATQSYEVEVVKIRKTMIGNFFEFLRRQLN